MTKDKTAPQMNVPTAAPATTPTISYTAWTNQTDDNKQTLSQDKKHYFQCKVL